MTSRQARTQRREAERKAAKLARKAAQALGAQIGFDSQNGSIAPPLNRAAILAREARPLQHIDAPRTQAEEFESQNAPSLRPRSRFVSQNAPSQDPNAERRREINRANAQHSTGPRSVEGKLASSRNSLKHGLASGELIIPGEDRAAFEALLNDLLEGHRPANPTEELLVNEIAQAYWLAQRAIHFQNQCFTESGVDDNRLSLFLRYQTTHDRRFHKALNTLIHLRRGWARPARTVAVVPQNTAARAQAGFVSQTEPASTPQARIAPANTVPEDPPAGFVSQTAA